MGPRFLWEHDPGREPRGGAGWLWDPGLLGWSLPRAHPEPGLGAGSGGGTCPSYREMEQVAPGTGSCPLCCVGPWEHSAWQAGRQAAASEPCLLSSLLSETPDTTRRHSFTTLCTGLPQGWRKAQPLRARDPQAQTRHTSGLLLPAASPELGCDHDRSAGCQGPALLLLPRGDTSPQVPFIPPTHRGMSVGGGGSLACPRPPVVTFGDFLLKDQWHRG